MVVPNTDNQVVKIGRGKKRGTTLVEVMVALVFLGICASTLLAAVNRSQITASVAQDRLAAFSLAQAQIQAIRATARTAALSPGITASSATVPTISTQVAVTKTITAVPGYSDLFKVQIQATWGDSSNPTRAGRAVVSTIMRAPSG